MTAPVDIVYGPLSTHVERRGSADPVTFNASWPRTLALLRDEAQRLGAEYVEIQVAVTAQDITRKGELRSRVVVNGPAARVVLHNTKFGTRAYATARFTSWKDNVRGVALSLEALRLVDRYGVGDGGSQHAGFALEAGPRPASVELGRELAELYGGIAAARKRFHPDGTHPDAQSFEAVQAAAAAE